MGHKAYSSAANRAYLRKRGSRPSSRSRKTRKPTAATAAAHGGRAPAFGRGQYKDRDTAGRCFGKLKRFRAVATRYDKREFMYQGTIDLASIRIWLRDPVP
jgi:transposase